MVDWRLARQIAQFAAGEEPLSELGVDVVALSAGAQVQVAAYTRLDAVDSLPPASVVGRREWAELNLDVLAGLLAPVEERLARRLSAAGPLAGPLRAAASATLAAEAGLVTGYMSQRVLGQYELSLLQPEVPARLLFVSPNLGRTASELDVDRASFVEWVVLHEVTHALQFSAVPWLRPHLADLLRSYLRTVEVHIEHGAAGGLPSLPDLGELVDAFREGGLVGLVQTREQRRIMSRLQAVMAVVEGYAEHVMDAVGAEVVPAYAGLREAMDRRRHGRSAPEKVLARLLGLDMKLAQYELGKSFCDAVADQHGCEGLNRVWSAPDALPSLAELRDPEGWAERTVRSQPPGEPPMTPGAEQPVLAGRGAR